MPKHILLDSAPLSLLATPIKRATPATVKAIRQWAIACDTAGHQIIVPEITDYEVRRELLRSRKTAAIAELDRLKVDFAYLPLTTAAMLKAADLWAQTRQAGLPTSHDENIDVDAILAAQALMLGVPVTDLVVATANVRHLARFVTADLWANIRP
jgi:predicted nucleic acid-binding protein